MIKNQLCQLMDLWPGDRFYLKSDKKKIVYEYDHFDKKGVYVKADNMKAPVIMSSKTYVIYLRSSKI